MAGEEVMAVVGSPVGSTSSPIGGKNVDLARWAAQPPSVAEDRTVGKAAVLEG